MGKCQTAPKDRRAARGEGRTRGWRDALAGCPVAVHMLTEHKCRYACAARTLAGIAAQRLVAVPGSCAAIPMIDCASHQGEAMECERGARAQQKWPLISAAGHPCAFHEFTGKVLGFLVKVLGFLVNSETRHTVLGFLVNSGVFLSCLRNLWARSYRRAPQTRTVSRGT